jgi:hypothetical protein
MAQYQAGMLVVYGKLGVHEIETVDLQSFCGFPRPQLYPHGKRRCSAPGAPAQQAEADLARIKEVRSCRKSNRISKRSNESGWLFSGRCVSDTPSCLGENPGRAT